MARTFEVETIYYTNTGAIKTKEFDLFDSKRKAARYMKHKIEAVGFRVQKDNYSDAVNLLDEKGNVTQCVKIGEI